ncbi:hypothetical protein IF188_06920 [Microbacterium sp. NEAU-LLC]|uniref:Glycosyl hydrolase family 13 catalytic domain-containing protein n=1 Tax=Microbacterium helvum TaxID=2773713 RepID=A0ABR8NN92_9MICO|nr:alpha-amylase family glycosyl hydrolase [Microbacterium helvum]MBD3941428.1 hypothetical protein [Microbacterium helvum]
MLNSPTQARSSARIRRWLAAATELALLDGAFVARVVAAPAFADPLPSPGPLAEGDDIYQVLVDRFKDGDTTNNDQGAGEYDTNDLGYHHGGDWAGLTEELDYIADLGITANWLSPVSEQQPLSRDGLERIPDGETFEFKPLIDDVTWSTGGNYTGTGGDVIDIYPTF